MPAITPFLWFNTEALEAAEFYASVFPNSKITQITYFSEHGPMPAGSVMTVVFELDGKNFIALNGGPAHTFSYGISLVVDCEDQSEIDHYWSKLSQGGKEIACGWLSDKYGVPWQIVPKKIGEYFSSDDPKKAAAAMAAMMTMVKFDIAALEKARAEA